MLEWTTENFRILNVLVNNAGVQRYIDFADNLLVGSIEGGHNYVGINQAFSYLGPEKQRAIFGNRHGYRPSAFTLTYDTAKVA